MADDEDPSQKYDQAFFLALAAKGKDAWYAWRRDPVYKEWRVSFAGIDFSEAPRDRIDFSGFEFGDEADFSGCKWRGIEWRDTETTFEPGGARFTGAAFGDETKFTDTAFGDNGDFTGVTFCDWAMFTRATFGQSAFTGATFGDHATFTRAVFDGYAFFDGVIFSDHANFSGASFGDEASFYRSAFGFNTTFDRAAFGGRVCFDGAVVSGRAFFIGASFGGRSVFRRAHFKGGVDFTGQSGEQWTRDVADVYGNYEEAHAALEKCHQITSKRYNSGPDRFLNISFANARFDSEAISSGRSFEEAADFTNARFYRPPNFDGVTNVSRIDFTGARIGFVPPGKRAWTEDSRVPLRLRALRKIAEDTKNHDLERDLYIEERKAGRGVYLNQLLERDELDKKLRDVTEQKKHVWFEWRLQRRARNAHWLGFLAKPSQGARLIAHCLWIIVMWFYRALADYGRNFVLPAAWLGLSVWLFHWRYGEILAPLMPQAGTLDAAKYVRAVWMVALGNAVPFVGLDGEVKKFLFCAGDANCLPPEGFQLLVIAQNVVSIILVFFIGLALRNYFRIK
jgi:hypothetical protein